MALTPALSTEYALQVGPPAARVSTPDWHGRLEVAKAILTFTAAGQGQAQMIRMPAGRLIIFPDLSRIVCPAGTTGGLLSIDRGAYVDMTGATVAAAVGAYMTGQSITSAIDLAWTLPADVFDVVESKGGFDINVTIGTQNSPASGNMVLAVVYGRAK